MNEALRVLHVVLSLNPGGAERLVIELARRLRPAVEPSVCCLDEPGAWAEELRAAGVAVRVLGRQPGFHPSLGLRLATVAREWGADLLHAHQYTPFCYSAIATLREPRLGLVVTEHGRLTDAPPTFKRRLANSVLSRRPAAVVAVSHELRGFMADEDYDPVRLRVIHNGIDVGPEPSDAARAASRAALGIADPAVVIGSVARFDAVKNLPALVEAFARIRAEAPAMRLVLVGDGPDRARIEARVRDLRMADAVTFTGLRDDARAVAAGFDIYANTSVSEGISLTILEAMAAGLPVVATAVGGNPEAVDDGVSGVLVPPGDGAALQAALLVLAADPVRRAALGRAGRSRAARLFNIDRMVQEYLTLYHDARRAG